MNSPSAKTAAPAKENLRITLIIFFGIVTGVFLFMLVSIFINQSSGPFVPALNKYDTIFIWGIGVLSLLCFVIARRMLWRGAEAAKNSLNSLTEKLSQYRSSLIRYLAICEVPAFAGVILFMVTGNFTFQLFPAVFLGFMLAVVPIRRRVVSALELDVSEQSELD